MLLLLLLAGLGAGLFSWYGLRSNSRMPVRILLVAPPPDPDAAVSHYQARVLAMLFQDLLEIDPRFAVTLASELPGAPAALKPGQPWLLVKFSPRRQQEKLGFNLEWAWSGDIRKGLKTWPSRSIPEDSPPLSFREALDALPLELRGDHLARVIPARTRAFWNLVQASTYRLQNTQLAEATRLARLVVEEDEGCASGWFALGSLIYRTLLDDPLQSHPEHFREAEACFRKGLALLPEHIRGTFVLAQLKTNAGDHREALSLLLARMKSSPRNPLLLTGIGYAARNAGLLELARRAADRRDRWAFTEHQPQAVDVLFLYLQEWERFEHTLRDQPGHLRNTVQRFYRGYLALLRKDKAGAVAAFLAAESVPQGFPHYIRLARAFRLSAEGDLAQAREELKVLDAQRTGLRVPDGEFALRMAEAACLAGALDSGMELAERAFAQGFGAALWYRNSPFLAPLRTSPRWTSLMRHLDERQALLESRFPPGVMPSE
ncbi:MAG: hypothetical protein HY823_13060 [Acidobacteria bacterium]|nr:hypothetical protein [Acidobacteriota bacterium]